MSKLLKEQWSRLAFGERNTSITEGRAGHSDEEFFDTIEKTPLTNEQAEAVISYDNRVQVVAAAGSGKTSVMVARSAYAIDKGFADPEKILLLAFNKNAAVELKERINERLSAAGIPSEGVQASTFHALGLNIIANSSGKKPRIAPWVENGQDIREILNIIDQLVSRCKRFKSLPDFLTSTNGS